MTDSPKVAVDVVIFTIHERQLTVLLVEVKAGPCAGVGRSRGLVPVGEAPDETAARELLAQTGIRDVYLEQLRTFGDPGRDPHTHVVSVAYCALLPPKATHPPTIRNMPACNGFRCASCRRSPTTTTPLHMMRSPACRRSWNTPTSSTRCCRTISRSANCRGVRGHPRRRLDRRNFRKKILGLGLLRAQRQQRRGAHRPAQLYAFTRRELMNIEML